MTMANNVAETPTRNVSVNSLDNKAIKLDQKYGNEVAKCVVKERPSEKVSRSESLPSNVTSVVKDKRLKKLKIVVPSCGYFNEPTPSSVKHKSRIHVSHEKQRSNTTPKSMYGNTPILQSKHREIFTASPAFGLNSKHSATEKNSNKMGSELKDKHTVAKRQYNSGSKQPESHKPLPRIKSLATDTRKPTSTTQMHDPLKKCQTSLKEYKMPLEAPKRNVPFTAPKKNVSFTQTITAQSPIKGGSSLKTPIVESHCGSPRASNANNPLGIIRTETQECNIQPLSRPCVKLSLSDVPEVDKTAALDNKHLDTQAVITNQGVLNNRLNVDSVQKEYITPQQTGDARLGNHICVRSSDALEIPKVANVDLQNENNVTKCSNDEFPLHRPRDTSMAQNDIDKDNSCEIKTTKSDTQISKNAQQIKCKSQNNAKIKNQSNKKHSDIPVKNYSDSRPHRVVKRNSETTTDIQNEDSSTQCTPDSGLNISDAHNTCSQRDTKIQNDQNKLVSTPQLDITKTSLQTVKGKSSSEFRAQTLGAPARTKGRGTRNSSDTHRGLRYKDLNRIDRIRLRYGRNICRARGENVDGDKGIARGLSTFKRVYEPIISIVKINKGLIDMLFGDGVKDCRTCFSNQIDISSKATLSEFKRKENMNIETEDDETHNSTSEVSVSTDGSGNVSTSGFTSDPLKVTSTAPKQNVECISSRKPTGLAFAVRANKLPNAKNTPRHKTSYKKKADKSSADKTHDDISISQKFQEALSDGRSGLYETKCTQSATSAPIETPTKELPSKHNLGENIHLDSHPDTDKWSESKPSGLEKRNISRKSSKNSLSTSSQIAHKRGDPLHIIANTTCGRQGQSNKHDQSDLSAHIPVSQQSASSNSVSVTDKTAPIIPKDNDVNEMVTQYLSKISDSKSQNSSPLTVQNNVANEHDNATEASMSSSLLIPETKRKSNIFEALGCADNIQIENSMPNLKDVETSDRSIQNNSKQVNLNQHSHSKYPEIGSGVSQNNISDTDNTQLHVDNIQCDDNTNDIKCDSIPGLIHEEASTSKSKNCNTCQDSCDSTISNLKGTVSERDDKSSKESNICNDSGESPILSTKGSHSHRDVPKGGVFKRDIENITKTIMSMTHISTPEAKVPSPITESRKETKEPNIGLPTQKDEHNFKTSAQSASNRTKHTKSSDCLNVHSVTLKPEGETNLTSTIEHKDPFKNTLNLNVSPQSPNIPSLSPKGIMKRTARKSFSNRVQNINETTMCTLPRPCELPLQNKHRTSSYKIENQISNHTNEHQRSRHRNEQQTSNHINEYQTTSHSNEHQVSNHRYAYQTSHHRKERQSSNHRKTKEVQNGASRFKKHTNVVACSSPTLDEIDSMLEQSYAAARKPTLTYSKNPPLIPLESSKPNISYAYNFYGTNSDAPNKELNEAKHEQFITTVSLNTNTSNIDNKMQKTDAYFLPITQIKLETKDTNHRAVLSPYEELHESSKLSYENTLEDISIDDNTPYDPDSEPILSITKSDTCSIKTDTAEKMDYPSAAATTIKQYIDNSIGNRAIMTVLDKLLCAIPKAGNYSKEIDTHKTNTNVTNTNPVKSIACSETASDEPQIPTTESKVEDRKTEVAQESPNVNDVDMKSRESEKNKFDIVSTKIHPGGKVHTVDERQTNLIGDDVLEDDPTRLVIHETVPDDSEMTVPDAHEAIVHTNVNDVILNRCDDISKELENVQGNSSTQAGEARIAETELIDKTEAIKFHEGSVQDISGPSGDLENQQIDDDIKNVFPCLLITNTWSIDKSEFDALDEHSATERDCVPSETTVLSHVIDHSCKGDMDVNDAKGASQKKEETGGHPETNIIPQVMHSFDTVDANGSHAPGTTCENEKTDKLSETKISPEVICSKVTDETSDDNATETTPENYETDSLLVTNIASEVIHSKFKDDPYNDNTAGTIHENEETDTNHSKVQTDTNDDNATGTISDNETTDRPLETNIAPEVIDSSDKAGTNDNNAEGTSHEFDKTERFDNSCPEKLCASKNVDNIPDEIKYSSDKFSITGGLKNQKPFCEQPEEAGQYVIHKSLWLDVPRCDSPFDEIPDVEFINIKPLFIPFPHSKAHESAIDVQGEAVVIVTKNKYPDLDNYVIDLNNKHEMDCEKNDDTLSLTEGKVSLNDLKVSLTENNVSSSDETILLDWNISVNDETVSSESESPETMHHGFSEVTSDKKLPKKRIKTKAVGKTKKRSDRQRSTKTGKYTYKAKEVKTDHKPTLKMKIKKSPKEISCENSGIEVSKESPIKLGKKRKDKKKKDKNNKPNTVQDVVFKSVETIEEENTLARLSLDLPGVNWFEKRLRERASRQESPEMDAQRIQSPTGDDSQENQDMMITVENNPESGLSKIKQSFDKVESGSSNLKKTVDDIESGSSRKSVDKPESGSSRGKKYVDHTGTDLGLNRCKMSTNSATVRNSSVDVVNVIKSQAESTPQVDTNENTITVVANESQGDRDLERNNKVRHNTDETKKKCPPLEVIPSRSSQDIDEQIMDTISSDNYTVIPNSAKPDIENTRGDSSENIVIPHQVLNVKQKDIVISTMPRSESNMCSSRNSSRTNSPQLFIHIPEIDSDVHSPYNFTSIGETAMHDDQIALPIFYESSAGKNGDCEAEDLTMTKSPCEQTNEMSNNDVKDATTNELVTNKTDSVSEGNNASDDRETASTKPESEVDSNVLELKSVSRSNESKSMSQPFGVILGSEQPMEVEEAPLELTKRMPDDIKQQALTEDLPEAQNVQDSTCQLPEIQDLSAKSPEIQNITSKLSDLSGNELKDSDTTSKSPDVQNLTCRLSNVQDDHNKGIFNESKDNVTRISNIDKSVDNMRPKSVPTVGAVIDTIMTDEIASPLPSSTQPISVSSVSIEKEALMNITKTETSLDVSALISLDIESGIRSTPSPQSREYTKTYSFSGVTDNEHERQSTNVQDLCVRSRRRSSEISTEPGSHQHGSTTDANDPKQKSEGESSPGSKKRKLSTLNDIKSILEEDAQPKTGSTSESDRGLDMTMKGQTSTLTSDSKDKDQKSSEKESSTSSKNVPVQKVKPSPRLDGSVHSRQEESDQVIDLTISASTIRASTSIAPNTYPAEGDCIDLTLNRKRPTVDPSLTTAPPKRLKVEPTDFEHQIPFSNDNNSIDVGKMLLKYKLLLDLRENQLRLKQREIETKTRTSFDDNLTTPDIDDDIARIRELLEKVSDSTLINAKPETSTIKREEPLVIKTDEEKDFCVLDLQTSNGLSPEPKTILQKSPKRPEKSKVKLFDNITCRHRLSDAGYKCKVDDCDCKKAWQKSMRFLNKNREIDVVPFPMFYNYTHPRLSLRRYKCTNTTPKPQDAASWRGKMDLEKINKYKAHNSNFLLKIMIHETPIEAHVKTNVNFNNSTSMVCKYKDKLLESGIRNKRNTVTNNTDSDVIIQKEIASSVIRPVNKIKVHKTITPPAKESKKSPGSAADVFHELAMNAAMQVYTKPKPMTSSVGLLSNSSKMPTTCTVTSIANTAQSTSVLTTPPRKSDLNVQRPSTHSEPSPHNESPTTSTQGRMPPPYPRNVIAPNPMSSTRSEDPPFITISPIASYEPKPPGSVVTTSQINHQSSRMPDVTHDKTPSADNRATLQHHSGETDSGMGKECTQFNLTSRAQRDILPKPPITIQPISIRPEVSPVKQTASPVRQSGVQQRPAREFGFRQQPDESKSQNTRNLQGYLGVPQHDKNIKFSQIPQQRPDMRYPPGHPGNVIQQRPPPETTIRSIPQPQFLQNNTYIQRNQQFPMRGPPPYPQDHNSQSEMSMRQQLYQDFACSRQSLSDKYLSQQQQQQQPPMHMQQPQMPQQHHQQQMPPMGMNIPPRPEHVSPRMPTALFHQRMQLIQQQQRHNNPHMQGDVAMERLNQVQMQHRQQQYMNQQKMMVMQNPMGNNSMMGNPRFSMHHQTPHKPPTIQPKPIMPKPPMQQPAPQPIHNQQMNQVHPNYGSKDFSGHRQPQPMQLSPTRHPMNMQHQSMHQQRIPQPQHVQPQHAHTQQPPQHAHAQPTSQHAHPPPHHTHAQQSPHHGQPPPQHPHVQPPPQQAHTQPPPHAQSSPHSQHSPHQTQQSPQHHGVPKTEGDYQKLRHMEPDPRNRYPEFRPPGIKSPPRSCDMCSMPAVFICSGCKKVAYCSEQCQSDGWDAHSSVCK